MADQTVSAAVKDAADNAVASWIDDYFRHVFGLSVGDCESKDSASRTSLSAQLAGDDFAARLSARFNDLDIAPRDGVVSYVEIERAIQNPLLHWDQKDLLLVKLLRRYYNLLIELSDDERERVDRGVSRYDVNALTSTIDESCVRIRRKLESEYEEK